MIKEKITNNRNVKKNIALVTGGDSGESVISLQSAKVIKENIDKKKFNVFTILMQGTYWKYIADDGYESIVDKNDFTVVEFGGKVKFDAVFIAIHGTPGEDGKLQGYLDILGIPYTFSGVVSSSLTFNKDFCQMLAEEFGATITKAVLVKKGDSIDAAAIIEKTGLPCFVKPNNGGSSIGMTKVKELTGLEEAVSTAFKEDSEVLVEEYIEGTEVTCGILQKKDELIALPITEIVSKHEFFDYTSKYDPKLADEITPARIPEEMQKHIKNLCLLMFRKFNLRGVARFDFIIKNNIPYFLEVNTIPGLSAASIVPKQAGAMGISLEDLFSILIENVL
jgi:D-alanine-D-alanine ligase